MNKIVITNRNRDGAELWFEQYNDSIYTIHSNKDWVLEYCSINFDILPNNVEEYDAIFKTRNLIEGESENKAKIISFDPSGGPYIAVGDIICGYNVKRIYYENGTGPALFELVKQY